MAGSGRRSERNRPTNSAARCCASAALPPLPKRRTLWPAFSAPATVPIARSRAAPFSFRKTCLARMLASNSSRMAPAVSPMPAAMVGGGSRCVKEESARLGGLRQDVVDEEAQQVERGDDADQLSHA